jgi:hypothetical protein
MPSARHERCWRECPWVLHLAVGCTLVRNNKNSEAPLKSGMQPDDRQAESCESSSSMLNGFGFLKNAYPGGCRTRASRRTSYLRPQAAGESSTTSAKGQSAQAHKRWHAKAPRGWLHRKASSGCSRKGTRRDSISSMRRVCLGSCIPQFWARTCQTVKEGHPDDQRLCYFGRLPSRRSWSLASPVFIVLAPHSQPLAASRQPLIHCESKFKPHPGMKYSPCP